MSAEDSRGADFSETQLVTFSLGQEEYGVPILQVQEIIKFTEITKVPRSPDFVKGVINLRGRVIAVIDLREKFGLLEKSVDKNTRIIIVESQGATLGLIVDNVNEVKKVKSAMIDPPPPIVSGISSEFIQGVARMDTTGMRLLIIIDLDKVLSTSEVVRLMEMAGKKEPAQA